MKHCEKCIHYELCKSRMECAPDDTFSFFPYNEDCNHFKNKADFKEVKHGEWIAEEKIVRRVNSMIATKMKNYKCSECGCKSGNNKGHRYCPQCGAKMDGKSDT